MRVMGDVFVWECKLNVCLLFVFLNLNGYVVRLNKYKLGSDTNNSTSCVFMRVGDAKNWISYFKCVGRRELSNGRTNII